MASIPKRKLLTNINPSRRTSKQQDTRFMTRATTEDLTKRISSQLSKIRNMPELDYRDHDERFSGM